jgi:putative NADH-flavin reductase
VLVIGAAPELVAAALERGLPVTVLARRQGMHPAGVRVVTGDVKFAASLALALEGESAVVSTLRGGTPVARLSLEALVFGMHAAGVRRLIAVSGELDDAVRASRLDWQLVPTPLAALDTLGA